MCVIFIFHEQTLAGTDGKTGNADPGQTDVGHVFSSLSALPCIFTLSTASLLFITLNGIWILFCYF